MGLRWGVGVERAHLFGMAVNARESGYEPSAQMTKLTCSNVDIHANRVWVSGGPEEQLIIDTYLPRPIRVGGEAAPWRTRKDTAATE